MQRRDDDRVRIWHIKTPASSFRVYVDRTACCAAIAASGSWPAGSPHHPAAGRRGRARRTQRLAGRGAGRAGELAHAVEPSRGTWLADLHSVPVLRGRCPIPR
jgi:hypothetical protein